MSVVEYIGRADAEADSVAPDPERPLLIYVRPRPATGINSRFLLWETGQSQALNVTIAVFFIIDEQIFPRMPIPKLWRDVAKLGQTSCSFCLVAIPGQQSGPIHK